MSNSIGQCLESVHMIFLHRITHSAHLNAHRDRLKPLKRATEMVQGKTFFSGIIDFQTKLGNTLSKFPLTVVKLL